MKVFFVVVVVAADVLNNLHVSSFMHKTNKHRQMTPFSSSYFTSSNWNYTQLLMFWWGVYDPKVDGSCNRNARFLKSWGYAAFLRQQQYWYVAPSCAIWHGGWWISNQCTDKDPSFYFAIPSLSPYLPGNLRGLEEEKGKVLSDFSVA